MRNRFIVQFVGAGLIVSFSSVQSILAQANDRTNNEIARPAQRFSNGRINLSGKPDEQGLWLPRDRTELGRRSTLPPVETIPFRLWAKVLYDDRQLGYFDSVDRNSPIVP